MFDPNERAALVKCIEFVWANGGVRSPNDGQFLEGVRAKLLAPEPEKKAE